jgi:hypothetical protein
MEATEQKNNGSYPQNANYGGVKVDTQGDAVSTETSPASTRSPQALEVMKREWVKGIQWEHTGGFFSRIFGEGTVDVYEFSKNARVRDIMRFDQQFLANVRNSTLEEFHIDDETFTNWVRNIQKWKLTLPYKPEETLEIYLERVIEHGQQEALAT